MPRPRGPSPLLALGLCAAGLLAVTGCRTSSVTALRVITTWEEIEIHQLEFTISDEMGNKLAPTELRPRAAGKPLPSGADVVIYFDDAYGGHDVRVTVRGFTGDRVAGGATATRRLVAQSEVKAEVALDPRTAGSKPNGEPCKESEECASAICADGVCCSASCTGTCASCNVPGKAGTCAPVPAGRKHAACIDRGAASCDTDGTCDGTGKCRRYPAGTACAAGTCTGSSVTSSGTCDGEGRCTTGPVVTCAPFNCNANARPPRCFSACTSSADCVPGRECVNGSCGKKDNGAACANADECTSGFCVDGVCCESRCEGACLSCALPGQLGMCRAVALGVKDPRGVCREESASTCGGNGLCDGRGACQRHAAGTVCAPSVCMSDTVVVTPGRCDGAGKCIAGGPLGCAPYACRDGACNATCSRNEDCVGDRVCDLTLKSCGKKPTGGACTGASECESGFCVDGVCCNEACVGACRSCALGRTPGVCSMIPAGANDPRGTCKDNGPAACNTDGTCDGTGRCRRYPVGTQCAPGSCTGSTRTLASTCDSAGRCVPGAQVSCGNYRCNGAVCFSSCASDANCIAPTTCVAGSCTLRGSGAPCTSTSQCAAPYTCIGSTCQLKPNGQACTAANQCASGQCTEGVCCDMGDCGRCKSCRVPGFVGFCHAVPAGTRDTSCTTDPVSSCRQDGTCDGAGGCRLYPAGTECAPASCATRYRINARTCDGMGSCEGGGMSDCAPYLCNPSTNACYSSCNDDAQCTVRCRFETCR